MRGVLARIVTYGLVAGLVLSAQFDVEQWPVTSFRLFSQVRTDRSVSLELVAVHDDDRRERISLSGSGQVVATTSHQLQILTADPPGTQLQKVRAWMDIGDVDPATVVRVQLERVERRLDPNGGPSTEVVRTVVLEVVP